MLKLISVAGALTSAALFSQAPAFSQAYLQRLAGQVDALTEVVVDFDKSALAAGLGREEALQQMTGTAFLTARQSDMRATFGRHSRLNDNLIAIRDATPMQRLAMPQRFMDKELAKATLSDFSPAMPLTSAGAVAAGAGAITGWVVVGLLLAFLTLPFRRRTKGARALRKEPALQNSPANVAQFKMPQLIATKTNR